MLRYLTPLLLLAPALSAGEGVALVQKLDDLRGGARSEALLYVEQDKVAVESSSSGRRATFVYLADEGLLRIIDHEGKTVREITEREMEQVMGGVQEQMAKMREQMESRMKDMSPQQRQMMEKMLSGPAAQAGALAATEKIQYRRGDGSSEIGGRACDWYEGYRGDELAAQVCSADYASLDLRPSDFAVFQRLAALMSKMAPQLVDQMRFGAEDWEQRGGFPGIPLEQRHFENGQAVNQMTLESVERRSIDNAAYAAPPGYKLTKGVAPR